MDVQLQLQQLLDRQAIHDVMQRYCRTMDWLDEPGHASCYWPDAHIDFGFFKGRADAFVPMVMEHERHAVKRWHLVTGIMIRLQGDRAEAESYGITTGMMDRNLPRRMYGGRYLDELQKRDGEWRFSKRVYILDWSKTYTDEAETAQITGGALNIPDISAPGHPLYRPL